MARKPRDSKYLHIRKNRAGNRIVSVQLEIQKKGVPEYSKNFLIDDYGTLDRALEAARKVRNEKLVEMDEHKLVVHAPTVGELFEKKFEHMPLSLKTQNKHRTIYADAIEQYASVPINDIKLADIQKSVNDYAKTHTEKQVSRCITVWRQIYRCAIMEGIPVTDWAQGATIPNTCKPERPLRDNSISFDDFQKFLDVLLTYNANTAEGEYKARSVWYMLQIIAYTGMRPAEAMALTREDFHINDSGNSYININKAVGSTETETRQIITTKTRKSRRKIPIDGKLVDIVRDLLKWTKREYVFTTYDGRLLDIDNLSNYVRLVSKKAHIHFTMYMLRHKFSTDLLDNGTPVQVVRDLMGHTNIGMTIGYAYSTEAELDKAINERKMA